MPTVFSFASDDFTDANGTISYTAMLEGGGALPSWLSFNPATRTFSASAKSVTGVLDVVITATGTDGTAATQDILVSVQPVSAALLTQAADQRVSSVQALSAAVPVLVHQEGYQQFVGGHAITITLPAGSISDPSGGVITYKASVAGGAALPTWLSFNAAKGQFTGTAPVAASNTMIVVTGVSSNGGSVSETFQLRSTDAPPVLAHQTANVQLTSGTPFSVNLATAFTDAAGEKLTLKALLANGSALPSWMVFNAATTILSGTAPSGAAPQRVVIVATDAIGQTVKESFNVITTAATTAPVVVSAPVTTAPVVVSAPVTTAPVAVSAPATTAPVVESDYLQTHRFFASTSPWNTAIAAGDKTSTVASLSNYLAGLTSWTTGGGNVAIYYAHDTDPLVAVYYNPYSWYEVVTGAWKQTGNTAAVEKQITSTQSATNPVPGNPYSTQNASLLWNSPVSGLPAQYDAWHQAAGQVLYMHVPKGAVPTPSSDGQTVIIQPDGTAVEMFAPVVLSSGAWESEMFSTTDAVNGTGTGVDNGRTASMIENYAGVLRDTDITSGTINHALALAIPATLLKAAFVGPALTFDASPNYSGTLAMGSHLALAPGTTAAGLGLLSTFGKEVALAASTYGMFVVDRGGSGVSIITQNDPSSAVLKSYGSAEQMDLNTILHHLVLLAN